MPRAVCLSFLLSGHLPEISPAYLVQNKGGGQQCFVPSAKNLRRHIKQKGGQTMDYYIKVEGIPVPVTEEVYKTYCRGERKELYFRESDRKNNTFFYDALDTEELNGCEMFSDPTAESVEEAAEKLWFLGKLRESMKELNESEQEMLCSLYVYGKSLRAFARMKRIPVTTLQARHQKLLRKLRKKLEIF